MIKNLLTYGFALFVLYSCKVTKDIRTPELVLPDSFRNAVAVTDTNSIADMQWKSFFTDAPLQQLIDSAIVKNFDMQVAVKNIESAQLLFKQVKWNYLPSANLNMGAGSSRPSDNSLNGLSASQFLKTTHIEDYTANVGLSWEADIWGKIRNQKSSALAQYLQTTEAKKAIQTNIIANVSQGYYNLLMLDAQLAIAKRNLALDDSTLLIIRLQYNAGQVTSLAIQQAEAQQLVAAQLIPQFEQDRLLQENAISILTGELPGAITTNTLLDRIALPDSLSAGVPALLVKRRPDVRSYELALAIANANVGITQAAMYPSLTITAAAGINSFKASNWFNIPASLFGAVAGGISQPLFQHKQLKTQLEIAKVEREKTVIQFRQSVLVAVGEVSDALARIEKLKTQKAIAVTRVNTLQQAIRNSALLFQNGMATYLEVITAQSNALQSELDLAVLKRAELSAAVELYRSLGGGQ
ncbi:MAG: efflux transporter outer membrane subunit [Ferruginibacter sp.]